MRHVPLFGVLALGAIVVISMIWLFDAASHDGTERMPAFGGVAESGEGKNHHGSKSSVADFQASAPENTRHGSKLEPGERRTSLERSIAAQEKLVAEKKVALTRWVRSNAVIYNPTEPPSENSADGDAPKGVNQVGGYVDLKNEYEVELQNLERMKRRLGQMK